MLSLDHHAIDGFPQPHLRILPENAPDLAPRVDVRAVKLVGPSIAREVSVLQLRNRALSSAALNMKRFLLEGGRARTAS